jgi:hypothetical protein
MSIAASISFISSPISFIALETFSFTDLGVNAKLITAGRRLKRYET